ncbi:MAG TPA: Vms1/Ankzf1 family peptidyl-tRNA hydrolase [Acidimicrobiales bacterium]|nr:Vms1/Ankzf1 family peptidyl-tRNA hydrolase [Acidimicrobiales bacterium]
METSGTSPRVAQDASAVPQLAGVFDASGPFVTLYLDASADVANAGPQVELRWKNARRSLSEAGAPESLLAEIDAQVEDAHTRGATLAVIGSAEAGVLYVGHEQTPPASELAQVGALPSILPVLGLRQQSPPFVVVLIDRTGAEIHAVRHDLPDIKRELKEATPDEVQKAAPGGWSQRRYHERAENAWESTAGEVAAAVNKVAERVDARVVIVSGDVRAVTLLQDELAPSVASKVVVVEGARAGDGGFDAIEDEVRRLINTAVAEDTVAALDKFREECGQHDRAADGVAATIEALQMARVDMLLVSDDPADDRTAFFGPDAALVAADAATLKGLGVDDPSEGRLVDVCVRAALGTGAGIRIVPAHGGPTDGIGAILRY